MQTLPIATAAADEQMLFLLALGTFLLIAVLSCAALAAAACALCLMAESKRKSASGDCTATNNEPGGAVCSSGGDPAVLQVCRSNPAFSEVQPSIIPRKNLPCSQKLQDDRITDCKLPARS